MGVWKKEGEKSGEGGRTEGWRKGRMGGRKGGEKEDSEKGGLEERLGRKREAAVTVEEEEEEVVVVVVVQSEVCTLHISSAPVRTWVAALRKGEGAGSVSC